MTTLREAALLALEALEYGHFAVADQAPRAGVMAYLEAIEIVRTALDSNPQRKPLTDEEILKMWDDTRNDPIAMSVFCLIACVRHVERAHGIGEKE